MQTRRRSRDQRKYYAQSDVIILLYFVRNNSTLNNVCGQRAIERNPIIIILFNIITRDQGRGSEEGPWGPKPPRNFQNYIFFNIKIINMLL